MTVSSTKVKFTAAWDVGKAFLYIRSTLNKINIPQCEATTLFIHINGALLMANVQQLVQ